MSVAQPTPATSPAAGSFAGLLRRARRRRGAHLPQPTRRAARTAPTEDAAARAAALRAAVHETATPVRARGLELLGATRGSGYRAAPGLIRRADGQTIQLTPLLYAALELVDGRRDHAAIAAELGARLGRAVVADDVRYLVGAKLRPLGVLREHDGSDPGTTVSNPLLGLRFKKVITDPAVTGRLTAPFARLFLPPVVALVTCAFAAVTWWLLVHQGLATATREALYEPGLLLLAFGLTVASAGFHEFGHAAACRYGGATPGAMGVGLYLVWPAFYTDVTDSYRLSRAGRLRVDLGGLYFNAVVAVATFGVWWASGLDALLLVIAGQIFQMLRQLTPFVRFDGYHILADLTGVPDLFAHLGPTLAALAPHRWGRNDPSPLKPWARAVVTLWVLVVVPVLLTALVAMVLVLPRLAATVWDSLGLQWQATLANWRAGDGYGLGVRALSVVALCVPLLSMLYLVARLVRRTALQARRVTAGRPVWRAAAVAAGGATIAFVAWAWWPSGDYRPIAASERWAVLDALPGTPAGWGGTPTPPPSRPVALATGPGDGADAGAGAVSRTGTAGVRRPVAPATAVATAASPAITVGPRRVLLVRQGRVTPYRASDVAPGETLVVVEPPTDWPFSFDRPPAPDEGDVQALAVNSVDGGVEAVLAHALVVVTGGERVEQRNEAYALARCTDCATTAAAFQVVLIVGPSDVVVPQNIAVAVNQDCERCVTQAVAVQLVVSVTAVPDDDVLAAIDAAWTPLRELEDDLASRTAADIRARLLAVEADVLRVLASAGQDDESGDGGDDEDGDDDSEDEDDGDEGEDDDGAEGEDDGGDEDEDRREGDGGDGRGATAADGHASGGGAPATAPATVPTSAQPAAPVGAVADPPAAQLPASGSPEPTLPDEGTPPATPAAADDVVAPATPATSAPPPPPPRPTAPPPPTAPPTTGVPPAEPATLDEEPGVSP